MSCRGFIDYSEYGEQIHTHTDTHTHRYTHTQIHTQIHTHTDTHTHRYIHTQIHTQTDTHTHRYTHMGKKKYTKSNCCPTWKFFRTYIFDSLNLYPVV